MIIFQTGPFWTSILGYLVNKEPILRFEYVAMTICFCGVLAISTSKTDQQITSDYPKFVGVVLAFLCAWLSAGAQVMNRKLKDIHFTVIGFWHAATGLAVSLLYLFGRFVVTGAMFYETHSGQTYFYMIGGCLIDLIGINAFNIAF
jgi:drug/metabolite transporter (DMT)-like permease